MNGRKTQKKTQLEKNLDRMYKDLKKWAEKVAKQSKKWY